jgi:glycosyltransferase involved in cell wall biosynthesis
VTYLNRDRVIAFVGRIEKFKGIFDLLTAWATVEHAGSRLVVAGDGPDLQAAKQFPQLTDVEFVGRLARDAISDLLGRAMWSFSGGSIRESFGLSAAESLAAGTPVVFRRRGALPETIGGAGLGFRYTRSLPQLLTSAVRMMGTDQWVELHDKARRQAAAYSVDAHVAAWDVLLRNPDHPRAIGRRKVDR